jgi:hypothetical protein
MLRQWEQWLLLQVQRGDVKTGIEEDIIMVFQ